MKKHSAILLSVTLLLCSMLFGCGTDAVQEGSLPVGFIYRRINGNKEFGIYTEDITLIQKIEETKIVFPSYYNGVPITYLGIEGLRLNPKVEEVVLPTELNTLESRSFFNCEIRSITIPAGCTTIESETFYSCDNLTEVQLLGSSIKIMPEAFRDCPNLEKFNLEKVTQIWSGAFFETPLRQIVIPASVESIGKKAFQNGVLTAILPKTVQTIGWDAFNCADIYTDAAVAQSHSGWSGDRNDGGIKFQLSMPDPKFSYWFGTGSHVFRGCTFQYDGDTPYVYSMPNRLLNYFDGEFTNEEGKAEEEFVPVRAFSVPFREGYTFKGWSLEEGSSEVEFGVTMFDPTTVPELQEAAGRNKFMQEPYLCSLSTVGDWLRFTPNQTLYAVWEKE